MNYLFSKNRKAFIVAWNSEIPHNETSKEKESYLIDSSLFCYLTVLSYENIF